MKTIIILGTLLMTGVTQAGDRYKTIECKFSESGYGLSGARLTIDKSSILSARMNSEGNLEINISDSECEDSTSISVEGPKGIADYKAGKTFEAKVKHETPDVTIEGYAICQQKIK